jgi:hypothetical protein
VVSLLARRPTGRWRRSWGCLSIARCSLAAADAGGPPPARHRRQHRLPAAQGSRPADAAAAVGLDAPRSSAARRGAGRRAGTAAGPPRGMGGPHSPAARPAPVSPLDAGGGAAARDRQRSAGCRAPGEEREGCRVSAAARRPAAAPLIGAGPARGPPERREVSAAGGGREEPDRAHLDGRI